MAKTNNGSVEQNSLEMENIISKIEQEKVKFIKYFFLDIDGNLKEMEIATRVFKESKDNQFQVLFDGSSVKGYGSIDKSDLWLRPDLKTFNIDALATEECDGNYTIGYFICDIYHLDGTCHPCCGRSLLKSKQESFNKINTEVFIGHEAEFFLFEETKMEKNELIPIDKYSYFSPCYKNFAEKICREISIYAEKYGLLIEKFAHEVAAGQFEINYKYSNCLKSADNFLIFRYITQRMAMSYGYFATFMPKPITGINGNGLHTNISVWKNGKNLFRSDSEEISSETKYFINGILEHGRGLALLTNASTNSYKRLIRGFEAPVFLSYSKHNRSTLIRIPTTKGNAARIEVRNVDSSGNIYLSMYAIISLGLEGLTKKLNKKEMSKGNLFAKSDEEAKTMNLDFLPQTLDEAIKCFDKDKFLDGCFSSEFKKYFLQYKNVEWNNYCANDPKLNETTSWEIKTYK